MNEHGSSNFGCANYAKQSNREGSGFSGKYPGIRSIRESGARGFRLRNAAKMGKICRGNTV